MKILNRLLTPLPMIFLAGCVTAPNLSELPATHPASAQAEHSKLAPMQPTLMAGSEGLVRLVSTNDAAMHQEHNHSAHAKPAPKPAEHAHEKDRPKQKEKK